MQKTPVVEVQMLIRRPVAEVFEAFIDPAITTRFWFTHSSGKLKVGDAVTWKWEMYGASATVYVQEIIVNQKIVTQWGSPLTTVEYLFTALTAHTTYVVIKNFGFSRVGDELIEVIKDSTGGFTTVLDGLKAYLEHGIELGLVTDKFPDKIVFNQ